MARNRSLLDRIRPGRHRRLGRVWPVRNADTFIVAAQELSKHKSTSRLWRLLDRLERAWGQRVGALRGERTEREQNSLRAWQVLVDAPDIGIERLRGELTEEFLRHCADTLEAAEVPPPPGGDAELGWSSDRFRVRDLIRRNLKRLNQPPPI